MKNKFNILIQIILIFILSTKYNNIVLCQDSNEDTIQANTIELDQGCKLVLDAKIDTTDSLSIEIIKGIRDIVPQIQLLIPADSITIDLAISSNVLPFLGVGSRTISDDTGITIEYYFDPKNPNFKIEFIKHGLVHEFLHASRLRMPQWQLTLLECMITEGLADHFMVEVTNCEQTPWSSALTEEQIQKNMIQIKPLSRIIFESWTDKFNNEYFVPWFFGRTGDNPIPGWTGYTLGWRIVENYVKAHPEARASSLVWAPAEIIVSSTPELIDLK